MERKRSSDLCGLSVGPEENREQYRVKKYLGAGAHGVVYLAYDTRGDEDVAVKFLGRGPCLMRDYVVREILNHQMLDHSHIIKFKKVFLAEAYLCIVMEYASGGDLHEHVLSRSCLDEIWSRWYFQQLVVALDYCHKRGVWMRDIKLQNILLKDSQKKIIKLCDFDFSKHRRDSEPRTFLGSSGYFAPELVHNWMNPKPNHRGYDAGKVDIWTCGVCLFFMLFGHLPFDFSPAGNKGKTGEGLERLLKCEVTIPRSQMGKHGEKEISEGCRDLLSKILKVAKERATLRDIMNHPWFREGLPEGFENYSNGAASSAPSGDLLTDDVVEKLVDEARGMGACS